MFLVLLIDELLIQAFVVERQHALVLVLIIAENVLVLTCVGLCLIILMLFKSALDEVRVGQIVIVQLLVHSRIPVASLGQTLCSSHHITVFINECWIASLVCVQVVHDLQVSEV